MDEQRYVILTREEQDNRNLAQLLSNHAIPFKEYPCIKTEYLYYTGEKLPSGATIEDFDFIVFSSRRAVKGMKNIAKRLSKCHAQFACVGNATADCLKNQLGIMSQIVPDIQSGEEMAHLIIKTMTQSKSFYNARHNGTVKLLYIRGDKSNPKVLEMFKNHQIYVDDIIVYNNLPPDAYPPPVTGNPLVVIASPSIADRFFTHNDPESLSITFLAIGSVTRAHLAHLGVKKLMTAESPTDEALFQMICKVFKPEILI